MTLKAIDEVAAENLDIPLTKASDAMRPSQAGEKLYAEWHGDLKVANPNGHFFGVASAVIHPAQVEEFFQHPDRHNHLLVGEPIPLPNGLFGTRRVMVLYTKTMSTEELQRLERFHRMAQKLIAEEDAERAEAQRKADEANAKAQADREAKIAAELDETMKLATIGRKCLKRHNSDKDRLIEELSEKVTKLEEENRSALDALEAYQDQEDD